MKFYINLIGSKISNSRLLYKKPFCLSTLERLKSTIIGLTAIPIYTLKTRRVK